MLIKNLTLSANDHLQKSTLLKDVLNDDTLDRFQGLLKGTECSKCQDTAIHFVNTINCGKCNRIFHIPCLIEPVDASVATAIKANPCLWWLCFHCLAESNNDGSIDSTKNDVDTLIDQKLEKVMSNFKKDILSSIDQRLCQSSVPNSKGLKRKADASPGCSTPKVPRTVQKVIQIDGDGDPSPDRSPSLVNNYNYASAANSFRGNGTNMRGNHHASNAAQRSPPPVDLIKPPQRQGKKFTLHFKPVIEKRLLLKNDEWYELRRTISESLACIKMTFSHFNAKTGVFVLGFPNESSKLSAQQKLSTQLKQTFKKLNRGSCSIMVL